MWQYNKHQKHYTPQKLLPNPVQTTVQKRNLKSGLGIHNVKYFLVSNL